MPTSLGPNAPPPGQTGQAVAILLPLTGPRADLGQVLLQAAQLALQDNRGPSLDVLDTGWNPHWGSRGGPRSRHARRQPDPGSR